jgi:hypothetical protein
MIRFLGTHGPDVHLLDQSGRRAEKSRPPRQVREQPSHRSLNPWNGLLLPNPRPGWTDVAVTRRQRGFETDSWCVLWTSGLYRDGGGCVGGGGGCVGGGGGCVGGGGGVEGGG